MEHVVKFGANTFIWASPFATATHLGLLDKAAAMGFNPYRRFRARPADIAMVVACMVIAVALLVWAVAG